MRVVSVNVGLPREIMVNGDRVLTGIFKAPVQGRVAVRTLNVDGDRQADLTVHGGPDKAVYAYPHEHYPAWRALLKQDDLPAGAFGENLTLAGCTEEFVHIGDRLGIGTTEFVVTQPRMPCFKLAAKFRRPAIVREMLDNGFSGFYLAVTAQGEVGAGNAVEVISRDPEEVSVADLNRLFRSKFADRDLARRALKAEGLAAVWREMLNERLARDAW